MQKKKQAKLYLKFKISVEWIFLTLRKMDISKLEKFHSTVFFLQFPTSIPLLLLNIFIHWISF